MIDRERIEMTLNAADAIEYFRRAGKELPHPGNKVDPDQLLEVISDQFLQRKRLMGRIGLKELTIRVEAVDLGLATMFLSDAAEHLPLGNFVIMPNPMPHTQAPHGDLRYHVERASSFEE